MKIAKVFHADHGVSEETLAWAIETIAPEGFFLRTLTLPETHSDLLNALYGPASGDEPIDDEKVVAFERGNGRGTSRGIALPKRPTRLLTVIGMVSEGAAVIFTAYGGPAAEREPTDPSIANDPQAIETARAFWKDHALAML